jgi:hypothetical protein
MQPVTPVSPEFKFELTDGFGYDKTSYKVYILQDPQTKQPILTTVLTKGIDLFHSKFVADACFKHGIGAVVKIDSVVLSMKLSTQKSNVFTFMKFYDFLISIKTLLEYRDIFNTNESSKELPATD